MGDLGQGSDFSDEECSRIPLWRVSQAERAMNINSPFKNKKKTNK